MHLKNSYKINGIYTRASVAAAPFWIFAPVNEVRLNWMKNENNNNNNNDN